jgi:hypothetical protein
MTLNNRVDPFGDISPNPARGTLMGNRGGRIHRDDRTLGSRRWASQQWICCRLEFKGRQRSVFGAGYTELFFLDEVTALAAGHRPCFECRREQAIAFAQAFGAGGQRPRAAEMDLVLHAERLEGRRKRTFRSPFDALPDGAMIASDGEAFALRGDGLLRWTPEGYLRTLPRPDAGIADVLTPPSIVAVLRAGYRPHWHQSAG